MSARIHLTPDGPHVAHVEDEAVAMWVDVDREELGNGTARYALRRKA